MAKNTKLSSELGLTKSMKKVKSQRIISSLKGWKSNLSVSAIMFKENEFLGRRGKKIQSEVHNSSAISRVKEDSEVNLFLLNFFLDH